MDQGLNGSAAGKQQGVSYTSLDSQTMAAANAAAQAAGLSLEEWLSRTILENARRSGIIPGQAASGPDNPENQSVGAITRHLRSAQAAADAAGISVAEWLSRTILDNTRRSMAGYTPPPEPGHAQPPIATSPVATEPAIAEEAATETPKPVEAGELVEERFAQVVAGWRQELETAEMHAAAEHPNAEADPRGILMLTDHAPLPPPKRRITIPWLAATGVVTFGLVAAVIWLLPHLPKPEATGQDGATGVVAGSGPAAAPAAGAPPAAGRPKTSLARVRPSEFPRPPEENAAWYKKAADAGNPGAQYVLATLYLRGGGVPKSLENAALWFGKAAREGKLAKAQYALGVLHARGKGVKKNDVEAVLLYRRAADQGYVPAITEVGLAFLHGRGVKQNLIRARQFLERAGEAGEVNAQYTLGRMHERGIGAPKDVVRALKWFILAAEQKHRLAAQRVEDMSIGMKRRQQDRAAEMARDHHRRFPTRKRAAN
jgi:hypothetical protein